MAQVLRSQWLDAGDNIIKLDTANPADVIGFIGQEVYGSIIASIKAYELPEDTLQTQQLAYEAELVGIKALSAVELLSLTEAERSAKIVRFNTLRTLTQTSELGTEVESMR